MYLTLSGCWLSTLQPHLGIVLVIARGDKDIWSCDERDTGGGLQGKHSAAEETNNMQS